MENYSLLMGAAAVMKMAVEMAAVSMEKPSGHFLRRAGTETPVPRSWLRDDGGSGTFLVSWLSPTFLVVNSLPEGEIDAIAIVIELDIISIIIIIISTIYTAITTAAPRHRFLADFVADWTEAPDASLEPEPETWVMHFDGSKQHQGSGAGVTLKSPTGEELQYVLQIHFEATNNMAEYEALLHGLLERTIFDLYLPEFDKPWMEQFTQTQFYQLGNGGGLVFEQDLTELSMFLGRPFPEFFGGQVNDNPEDNCSGSTTPAPTPTTPTSRWLKDETIKIIAKERKTLRRENAKKDYTISRLRAKIASLKETIKTQEDQLKDLEGEGEGEDIQGDGYSYVSNDNDYEEEEDDEDLAFHPYEDGHEHLEAGMDDTFPINVDEE
ncbi:hypothetical protein QYE76_032028 [Lolium multiflorum]|uniref:Uncharacterized protein n=1 Tax=Lolium multiflorum TaxID=4521 RepID=A0AAD8QSP9_LOLMU|nr:hypothetical protein QYE76_032028 [Lolium multiflorum]